ncbi:MAG: thioredoxin family protein [candidate division WOR-3 bacterium]|nr:thioredoxin family protein [candidate division WOR-3 bacterium]MDW8150650.1 thioredoxin family protein [candidate division WOR-3 bacterium]
MIREEDKKTIKKLFDEKLKDNVKIIFFMQNLNCEYCYDTERLLNEISELSEKIKLEKYNLISDEEVAKKWDVSKVPAIILTDEDESIRGVRYFGIPAGYEFSSLIEDIIMVSNKDSGLSQSIRERLSEINQKVHILVFVTPTCPYCPRAVRTAHKFALENPNIISDMIEAIEFPDLADSYFVHAVPKIVINEKINFEGALPDEHFLNYVLKSVEV